MDLKNIKIGFVGFGNMGQAIAEGWLKSNKISANQLYASARNQVNLQETTHRLGITAVSSNEELAAIADVILIAVKPYQIKTIFEPMKDAIRDKVLVSVAVNVFCQDFKQFLLEGTQYLSTLPNTPVAIGEGTILFEEQNTLTSTTMSAIQELFEELGHVEIIPTKQMQMAGIISGSAPAFVALFMEALSDAAVKHGLNRQTAYQLTSHMLAGTGKLQLESCKHPGELKDAITSPSGTTIKGISALEKNNFRGSVFEAVDAILNEQ